MSVIFHCCRDVNDCLPKLKNWLEPPGELMSDVIRYVGVFFQREILIEDGTLGENTLTKYKPNKEIKNSDSVFSTFRVVTTFF